MTDALNDTDMGLKLEKALKAAADNADARPDFYKQLMDAQVYVVGRSETEHEGEANSGPHLQLKQWKQPDGTLAMPFFATMESFRDMFGFSEPHILIPVPELFRFAGKETKLVLTSIEGSKDFKPDEVEMLLNLIAGDPLALALERAIQNTDEKIHAALWNDFYVTLVNARLLVLGKPAENPDEKLAARMIKDGESLSLAAWTHPSIEGPVVPFFSSQKILNQCVPAGEPYISLPAMDFLKMAAGFDRPLVLNPGHKFNKVFVPQEVRDILTASQQKPQEAPQA
ncbi:MAG: SseB family protein [Candidatus Adiutrix sp.]|jgi:hypothetical protein|nr:SseB family protein [Candidatus Adiutrix sp.]